MTSARQCDLVTNRTAATRYARALLDVASKEQADLSKIDADLAAIVDLFAAHPPLSKTLLNPAIPAPRKRAAVEALVARLAPSPIVGKLVTMLAERDRLVLLPDLLAAYRQRVMDRQGVVRAELTTAEPLDASRAEAVKRSLAQATGKAVELTSRVDPAIVGGLVARVGGTVYDASVTSQLKRLKQRLEESI